MNLEKAYCIKLSSLVNRLFFVALGYFGGKDEYFFMIATTVDFISLVIYKFRCFFNRVFDMIYNF